MLERNEAVIEGILFACGEAVSAEDLASVLEISKDETEQLLNSLSAKYEEEHRGLRLLRLEDSWQLTTDRSIYLELIKLVSKPRRYRLTEVMMETLAIITYKQPVTRAEIERIRGTSATHALERLSEYGLIEEAGRLRTPGRPMTYKTTEEFLRYFPAGTLDELPDIDVVQQELLEQEVRNEVGVFEDNAEDCVQEDNR